MKILHCIASCNPVQGGPAEHLRQIAKIHARRGTVMEVVSLDDPSESWLSELPYKVHPMGPGKLGVYGYTPRLKKWLVANLANYDGLVINGIWQYHLFAGASAAWSCKVPYIVFTHGMLDPWFKRTYPIKHLKKWLVWPWSEYRALRNARAVMFTCEEERRLAAESFWLYRCTEQVTGYGTTEPAGDSREQVDKFRKAFPFVGNGRKLIYMGRIHEKKGIDILIEALGSMYQADSGRFEKVQVLIAGDNSGAYAEHLMQRTEELGLGGVVFWLGMLKGDVKFGALRDAETFILPSHQENFGIAVAEALACGTPVIITDKVNIWREIEAMGAGWVGPDNISGVASLLARWIEMDSSEVSRFAGNAFPCFEKNFSVEQAYDSIVGSFEREARGLPSSP